MAKTKQKTLTAFNIRIKLAREGAGLKQAELAAEVRKLKVRCTQGAIDKLENRPANGSTKVVHIAAACGVSPYWLATGEGEMIPKELTPEAMAIAAAWTTFKPKTAQDRFTHEFLNEALAFLPGSSPWYKTATRIFREAAKRRGIKVDLKEAA